MRSSLEKDREADAEVALPLPSEESTQIETFRSTQSDNPYFVKDLQFTREEEARVIRILDTRIFIWILGTTVSRHLVDLNPDGH